MKIKRNGEVKLGKADVRVGNFVYTLEDGHVKVSDIGGMCTHRVSRQTLKGQILEMAMSDYREGVPEREVFLKGYAAVMMNVLLAPPLTSPDGFSFLLEANALAERSIKAFPELYGMKEEPSEEEDAEALDLVKGVREDAQMLKEKLGKE